MKLIQKEKEEFEPKDLQALEGHSISARGRKSDSCLSGPYC